MESFIVKICNKTYIVFLFNFTSFCAHSEGKICLLLLQIFTCFSGINVVATNFTRNVSTFYDVFKSLYMLGYIRISAMFLVSTPHLTVSIKAIVKFPVIRVSVVFLVRPVDEEHCIREKQKSKSRFMSGILTYKPRKLKCWPHKREIQSLRVSTTEKNVESVRNLTKYLSPQSNSVNSNSHWKKSWNRVKQRRVHFLLLAIGWNCKINYYWKKNNCWKHCKQSQLRGL